MVGTNSEDEGIQSAGKQQGQWESRGILQKHGGIGEKLIWKQGEGQLTGRMVGSVEEKTGYFQKNN